MNEFIKLSERFPEENDIVYFHDGNGSIYRGFYILPYRAYPTAILTRISLQSGV